MDLRGQMTDNTLNYSKTSGSISFNASRSISFNIPDGDTVIKLENNGDIYIKGKLVTNDMEVIEGFKEFFAISNNCLPANWQSTFKHMSDSIEYYRGLVQKIGLMFGEEALISDDGSVQDEVLCAKVPELVAQQLCLTPEQFEEIMSDE